MSFSFNVNMRKGRHRNGNYKPDTEAGLLYSRAARPSLIARPRWCKTCSHSVQENAGAPQPPRLNVNGKLAQEKTVLDEPRQYCAERPAIRLSRQVPPFQTPAGDSHAIDFRQPGQLSISGPRNPSLSGCELLSPAQRAPWALRLPITRDLPLSVSRKISVSAARQTHRHTMPKTQFSISKKLSIERYTTSTSAPIARF